MARKYRYAQERCIRLAGRLSQEACMLHPGARVGIAVSGGADSWVLLQVMRIRQGIVPFPFEIMALHVNPGFKPAAHAPLAAWLAGRGIAAHLELADHGLEAHSGENRKRSPCFLCAMRRRTRLFALCRQYRLTHLALGHNADDLAATFFMNLMHGGRVDGMAAKEAFFGGRLILIRPLLFVRKAVIEKAAREWNLPVSANPCPSAGATSRSGAREALERLTEGDRKKKNNIFNALEKWQRGLTQNSSRE